MQEKEVQGEKTGMDREEGANQSIRDALSGGDPIARFGKSMGEGKASSFQREKTREKKVLKRSSAVGAFKKS